MDNAEFDFAVSYAAGGEYLLQRVEEISALYAPESADYFRTITEKAEKNNAAFINSACSVILLDNLMSKHGINRAEMIITRAENGRPNVSGVPLDFSISHTGGAVLCAAAFGEGVKIGADIQDARDYSAEKRRELARIFMSERDYAEYIKTDSERFFYFAWTHRESYIKGNGGDVFMDLRGIDVTDGLARDGVVTAGGMSFYYTINIHKENL